MMLKDIGEFDLIKRFAPLFRTHIPAGVEGIGNDCAVFPLNETSSFLVTTDLLVENTHFIRNQISAYDLGYKALAVNLSDIAAMGGKAHYAFLSFALPIETSVEWIDSFMDGFRDLAEQTNVLLLGGDTTRSTMITINVLVIGQIENSNIKRRSHALPGDIICCTGYLGDSGAGLKILLERLPQDNIAQLLIHSHFCPRPHMEEGIWLAKQPGVHAMMDISDGLASDIQRIMEESNCGAHLEVERLPISDQLKHLSKLFSWQPEELALTAGEDYCLLVTINPNFFSTIRDRFSLHFHRPLYQIGTILPTSSLLYTKYCEPYTPSGNGFDHFKSQ